MSKNSNLTVYTTVHWTTSLFLYVGGLYPLKNPKFLYRLVPFLYIFSLSLTIVGIVGFIRIHATDIILVAKGMSILVSLVSTAVKLMFMIAYRKRMAELYYILDKSWSRALNDERLRDLVLYGFATVRRLSWTLTIGVFIMTTMSIASPLLKTARQKHDNATTVTYPLIYPGIYPWEITNVVAYHIHYFVESMTAMIFLIVPGGVDSLFPIYIFQMIGQLRVMAYKLTHATNQGNVRMVIKECVEEYKVLLMCQRSTQDIFGPLILWIVGTSATVQCTLIFQLTKTAKDLSVGQWTIIICHLVPKLTQTYIYTWSGTILSAESEEYRKAIYRVNWFSNKNIMSSIVIMLTQKTLTLTACKFLLVSVEVFAMIIKTTVSYFFLLRTLDSGST